MFRWLLALAGLALTVPPALGQNYSGAFSASTITAVSFIGDGSQLTNVNSSTSTNFQNQINALNVSTAAQAIQITALGASTATESAARISGFNAVSVSTTANAVAIATNSAVIAALSVSSAAETAARIAGDNALALSSAAQAVQITALGASTATESAARISGLNAVAVSSTALGVAIATNSAVIASLVSSTGNFVQKTGDIMTGDLTVNISTIYAQGGSIAISSASSSPASWLIIGRTASNGSFITNSNVSGSITLMPGKANPQILMGNAQTTGSIFWDASSGRPFFIQGLTTGTVSIGSAGVTIDKTGNVVAPSSITATTGFIGNTISISSTAFFGVSYSTIAAGGAGALVTVTCPSGKYAEYGGCDCTGIVAGTSIVNRPNSVTAGVLPTGHTCQVAGGTGGACAAFVRCSFLQ